MKILAINTCSSSATLKLITSGTATTGFPVHKPATVRGYVLFVVHIL